jgi:hypothetical protein
MSEVNKFQDMLGLNFQCQDAPPRIGSLCPNIGINAPGPDKNDLNGELTCIGCRRLIGQDNAVSDDLADDDVIDEENAEDVAHVFVAEADKGPDRSPEEDKQVARKKVIQNLVSEMVGADRDFALYLSNNQEEIVNKLRELEKGEETSFRENTSIAPKIIAVASHMLGRLPNNKALKIVEIKTKNVYDRKRILDRIYDTSPENEVSKQISSIGSILEVPEPIIIKAIDDYEKISPTNKEPKIQVLAAAWLYLQCKKSKWRLTKQKINESIPGVSRNALNQAIESYRVFMRNLNGTMEESTNEES